MKPLEVNKTYNANKWKSRSKKDHNKYVFSYEIDVCWDQNEELDLNEAWKSKNEKKFLYAYNKRIKEYGETAVKVIEWDMVAGWPCIEIHTDFMTIEDFLDSYEYEMEDFVEFERVKIIKVQEVE